jgi:tetrahydromethanopterin S-methyltransferase subunit G
MLRNFPHRLLTTIQLLAFAAAVLAFVGCANGIVGKNTNKNIADLTSTVNKTDTVLSRLITDSRNDVLDYIKNGTRKTTRDVSMGILEGTIGYIDDPINRKNLIDLIDSLIDHAIGKSRVQLIALRDELVNDHFIGQVSKLAHELMHQLIVQPGTDLLNVVLNPNTRRQLEALLQMPIAAVLNDRAIGQIAKLRDTLLGTSMKRNIAGLVDTALLTLNARLETQLTPTITKLTDQIGKQGKNDVNGILYVIIGGVILIAIVIFVLQELRVRHNKKMLYYVTREIENFRKTNSEANFQQLTGHIRETMLNQRLEGDLRKFLYEEGINKTT